MNNYYASDVAIHNDTENGFWISIERKIYDITNFLDKHPGGKTILMNCAGRDATAEYRAVLHHKYPNIENMLNKLYIGDLVSVNFNNTAIQTLYTLWQQLMELILEMENTLHSDLGFFRKSCILNENPMTIHPYKIDLLLETHDRFITGYLNIIIEKLEQINANTRHIVSAANTHHISGTYMRSILLPLATNISNIRLTNATCRQNPIDGSNQAWDEQMMAYYSLINIADTDLLSNIKSLIISINKLFESQAVLINMEIIMPYYAKFNVAFKQYSNQIETGLEKYSVLS